MEKSSPLTKKPRLNNEQAVVAAPRSDSAGAAAEVAVRNPPVKQDFLSSTSQCSPAAAVPDLSTNKAPAWFVQFFADFENRQDARIESILDKKLGDLTSKVLEHEEKISSLYFVVDSLKDSVQALQLENGKLERKLDDLENRSRRNNIVVFGIQESNDKEDCRKVIQEFLRFAEVPEDAINDIQRCHRTPSFRPQVKENAQQYPRRIHLGFGSYTAKERARKACIKKLKANASLYRDHKVFVAEDLSQRVLQLRKAKAGSFKRLKEEGKRPFFVFPDKLCYKNADGKIITA